MAKPMTFKQFQAKFPTDDACLEHLFHTATVMRFLAPNAVRSALSIA